jgi:hypothetical protein
MVTKPITRPRSPPSGITKRVLRRQCERTREVNRQAATHDWSDIHSFVVGVGLPSRDFASNVLGAEAVSSVQLIVPSTQNPDVLCYRSTQRCPRLDVIELQERARPQRRPSADTNEHWP